MYRKIYNNLTILLILVYPTLLFAGIHSDNVIAETVCRTVNQLTGLIGQSISTVAVIFIGIGLFMGKISGV